MKRHLIFILFQLSGILTALAQPITLHCHVEDAATGEALPYVSIYVSKSNTTISNHEGDFTIVAEAKEVVRVSYVGYETLQRMASEMPDTIRMHLQERTLHQLTVMPIESILMAAKDRLNKEYKKKRKQKDQYFCRLTTRMGEQEELTEAFLQAKSAINLRELTMLNGRRGKMTRFGMIRPELSDVNLQHALELSPMMQDAYFWHDHIRPIPINADHDYFRKYYELRCEVLTDSTGRKAYCIDMQKRKGSKDRNMLVGQLYIDAQTYQLLRFEGEVTDMWMDVTRNHRTQSQRVDMKLHINYTLRDGFTEVDDISCEVGRGELHTQTILHNVSNLKIKFKKRKAVKNNFLSAIDAAGFDAALWKHAGIILRTPYEEQLARQQAELDAEAVAQHTGNAKLDEMIDRARLFGQRLPQEKVFLHLDNTCYFLGDTIWYAAYTRQTNNGKPSHISNVLYVELLNHDGYVMERQVVKMKDGRGHGNIYLDPEYYAGFYEIRAYTRWQLNWGVSVREHGHSSTKWFVSKDKEYEFFRDYDKLYGRVIPVYDQPEDSTGYVHDMTLRPMRRYFRKDPDKRELQISLFPEGGNLVAGLPCRVAYEAAWSDGEWVDGVLSADTLRSSPQHRGKGVFTIVPTLKDMPKLSFLTDAGEKVKGKWPKVEKTGVSLSVKGDGKKWNIDLWMTEDMNPDSLAMTFMHEGVLTDVVALRDRHKSLELNNSNLAPGVHQVTVFSESGHIWADRLFFVTDTLLAQPNIVVNGLKEEYEPYEPIQLDIVANLPKPEVRQPISLSVRDGWNQDHLYDTGNMLTEMLLASEVKGFIPQPEWYFESQDGEHRQALDLLMMTQGWRRYSWHEMAVPHAFELLQPNEQNLIVEGSVKRFTGDEEMREFKANGGSLPEGRISELMQAMHGTDKMQEVTVHGELVEGQTLNAIETQMDTQGRRFRLKLPDFYDKSILFLSAADLTKVKPGKNYSWIQSAFSYETLPKVRKSWRFEVQDPDYMVYLSQPYPRYAQPFNWYQLHLAPAPENVDTTSATRHFVGEEFLLNEVSIKARRRGLRKFNDATPAFTVDAYEAWNNAMDAGFHPDPEFLVRGYIGDLGLDEPYAMTAKTVTDGSGNISIATVRSARIDVRFGLNPERRMDVHGIDTDSIKVLESMGGQTLDTLYHHNHLWSMERELSAGELRYYFKTDRYNMPTDALDISKLEKFVIYTDYAPRHSGENRYLASNLPETKLAVYPYPDGGRRQVYRDRRWIIQGFNIADDFYHPDYSQHPLPQDGAKDRRRTLYWNPDLQLDAEGHAHVSLYNCGRNTQLSVTAEGMTKEGVILTGKEN